MKALFKMYCYTQCTHLAVHDYLSSSSFRETGQDTTICKQCFYFENYDSLMSLLEQTDKFATDTSPAVSFIAEGDEDVEDEPPPGDDIPPEWDTWDQQKKQEFFLRVQKGKAVQPKKRFHEMYIPKLYERVKCCEKYLAPVSTEALLRSEHQLTSSKMFMMHMINTRRKELKVKHCKILMRHLYLKMLTSGKLYLSI